METRDRVARAAGAVDNLVQAGAVAVVGHALRAVAEVDDVGVLYGGYLRGGGVVVSGGERGREGGREIRRARSRCRYQRLAGRRRRLASIVLQTLYTPQHTQN